MNNQKEYILQGLACASCAGKIETSVKKIHGVKEASLDFVSCNLKLELKSPDLQENIEQEIKRIVNNLEPHVQVVDRGANDNKAQVNEKNSINKGRLIKLGGGMLLYLVALLDLFNPSVNLGLFVASYFLIGGEIVLQAVKNIGRGQVFDENFLMTLATIGAFAIQEYPEAVGVMLFYQIGELLQDRAVDNSRNSIQKLLNIKPDVAWVKREGDFAKVTPEEVEVGDIIMVKPGERVPLDGEVIQGSSFLDTSALTGESVPRRATVGDNICSGYINTSSVLYLNVTNNFSNSSISKILRLMEEASRKKAPTEKFITKFARYYTPAVVLIALGVALLPPVLLQESFAKWIYRSLIFLVVSCPCALVISIPLSYFGGIGKAAKQGILVKGGSYLETLNSVKTIVFDKTGTLTKGAFQVISVTPEPDITEEQLLEYAALVESYSNHPIAQAILRSCNKQLDSTQIDNLEELPGLGVKGTWQGKQILAGNMKLLEMSGINGKEPQLVGTAVHVALDNKYLGHIVIADSLKEDSVSAVAKLKELGHKIIILSGDKQQAAEEIGSKLQVDQVYAELLPQDKVTMVVRLIQSQDKGKLIFVGDGINDAPALARADIGISMGGVGSDAAVEASDIVLMNDEPSKLVELFNTAGMTRKIVWQNIYFSLGVKAAVMLLGAGGMATMWEAVFADVGVALLAVLNSMRIIKSKSGD